TMATSLSSSTEYWASSILRWFRAVLFTGWFWTRKLRDGSRLRSLSTKSFSVYSGPLSSGGSADAVAEAAGGVRTGGGGAVGVELEQAPSQPRASGSAREAALRVALISFLRGSARRGRRARSGPRRAASARGTRSRGSARAS